jgi:hypothetical protein
VPVRQGSCFRQPGSREYKPDRGDQNVIRRRYPRAHRHASVPARAFTYYSDATQIMFQFNQIYRNLESSLTEAAQFTELLLTPPTVTDPVAPEPLRPAGSDVRFERVTFAHAGGLPLFSGLDLVVPGGTKVGRSGGAQVRAQPPKGGDWAWGHYADPNRRLPRCHLVFPLGREPAAAGKRRAAADGRPRGRMVVTGPRVSSGGGG